MIIFANTYAYITVFYTNQLNDCNYQFTSIYKNLNNYIINSIFFFILIENSHNYLLILYYNNLLNHFTDFCKKDIHTINIIITYVYYL